MMINAEIADTMVRMAREAKEKAYVPYSGISAGACALASDGTLYGGCNIENASYGLSCCAERVAIYKGIADAKDEFDAVAIVKDTDDLPMPCGACLEVMAEFGIENIVSANLHGDMKLMQLRDLLTGSQSMKQNDKEAW